MRYLNQLLTAAVLYLKPPNRHCAGSLILLIFAGFLTGCGTLFVNRFPAETPLVETDTGVVQFTARSSEPHELHLMLTRSNVDFPSLLCLLGDVKSTEYRCASGEQPMEITWEVLKQPDNVQVASGKSLPPVDHRALAFSVDWVARNIGGFSPTVGVTYEIRARLANPTALGKKTVPKVIVRINALNSW